MGACSSVSCYHFHQAPQTFDSECRGQFMTVFAWAKETL